MLATLHGAQKKVASNRYQSDDDRLIDNSPGPTHNQVPGDYLGFPSSSRAKTANSRLRKAFKLVEDTLSPEMLKLIAKDGIPHSAALPAVRSFNAMLNRKNIGYLSLTKSPAGPYYYVGASYLKEPYQGLGLGKKMYGDAMRLLPDQQLASSAVAGYNTSDKAQRVWKTMTPDKGYRTTDLGEGRFISQLPDAAALPKSPPKTAGVYSNHAALNLGQALRDARYLTNHPHADNVAEEGTTKHMVASLTARLPSLLSNLYYAALPPSLHHTEEELKDAEPGTFNEWLHRGYAPWDNPPPGKKKEASNRYQSDDDRLTDSRPGSFNDQVPGDYLGFPSSSLVGMRSIKGGDLGSAAASGS